METHLLDLRQMHCPMALLLVKRHTQALSFGEKMQIYLSDPASISDIKRYLRKYAFSFSCEALCEEKSRYFCLEINKLPVERGAKLDV